MHVYVGTYYMHTFMIITVYVCQSFDNTDTQITKCRAYKYDFNISSPVSTCFRVYKININTAHWNTKPFPGASTYALHVCPDISKLAVLCLQCPLELVVSSQE